MSLKYEKSLTEVLIESGLSIPGYLYIGNSPAFLDLLWTPNFNGVNSYGKLLSAWQPSGADWEITVTGYFNNAASVDETFLSFADTSVDSEFFHIFRETPVDEIQAAGIGTNAFLHVLEASQDSVFVELTFSSTTQAVDFNVYDTTSLAAQVRNTIYRYLDGQIHSIKLTDLNDPTNSIEIDTVIRAAEMPSETNIYNKLTGAAIGTLYNLGTDQPYVPQLKGGEIDRRQVDGKFEMYLGSYSVGDFDNGVDTAGAQLSVAGTQVGSTEFTGFEDYIVVLKTGAVLKLTTIPDANTANYSVLLGTAAQIQSGAEYPNVARVLEPDATVGSEYKYFNDGGSYPFLGV